MRCHSTQKHEQLIASIETFGLVLPIPIDGKNRILNGQALARAAKAAGMIELPVVRVGHLSEVELRALRIGPNRLGKTSSWDEINLALEFEDLHKFDLAGELSFELDITGFHAAQIDSFIDRAAEEDQDDDDDGPDEGSGKRPAPVSREGDLFDLGGRHLLLCGNARDPACVKRLLGDERAAMQFTDPPWDLPARFISSRHGNFVQGSGELGAALTDFLADHMQASVAVMRPGAILFECFHWRDMRAMLDAGDRAGLELVNLVIWDKGAGAMGSRNYRSQHELIFMFKVPGGEATNNVQLGKFGRNRTNVWSFPGAQSLRKELELHPTPKPPSMVGQAIRDVSDRGDIVLDCFSGSGTTLLAAEKTGRRARVMDLDPHHVDVALLRWHKRFGGTARHVETGLSFAELAELRRGEGNQPALPATIQTPPRVRQRIRRAA